MTMNGDTDNRPRFTLPPIVDHPNGWGPTTLREDFKDMPYQPFSKDTKLGKVADWTGNVYHDKRHQHKYTSHLNSGSQYAYFHEEDESSFQLVDTMKVQKSAYQRQRMRFNAALRARRDRDRRMHNQNVTNMQTLNKTQLQRERDRQRQIRKWQKQYYGRQAHDYNRRGARNNRDASVQVQDTWAVLEELDFLRLGKLCLPVIGESKDIYTCGALEYYDKSYDRVSTKNERRLGKINRVIHMVTTTQDPIIQRLAKEKAGNVFCTDAILATLMTCTRSNYSWDIVVQKIGDKLFFDKREDSDFDLLTVRETATDPPHEEGNHINSPENLALEATFIQHNFTQQVLKMNDDKFRFPHPNPFMEDANDELASVGYRYRRWELGNDISLIVRCEHDAVTLGPNQETQFMNIKTLMEWDSRAITNAVDWRAKLDTQRGAVLASELKNNAFKLAKWTACSLLAGSDQLKFGFVSRINPKDSSKHVILGTSQFKPQEFANQINLNMENAWGIIRCIIDMLMKRESGKYLIMKDPNKPMVRIYDIPNNAFESDSSEDEDDDDDDDDDDEVSNRRN